MKLGSRRLPLKLGCKAAVETKGAQRPKRGRGSAATAPRNITHGGAKGVQNSSFNISKTVAICQIELDFAGKCCIFVLAQRREPIDAGFLLFFCPKISDFYLGDRKIYLRDKNFFWLLRIFFGPSWCAQWRFRKFFGLQILKDIKVFGAKKLHFNISSNYSGGFLIANCAGKKCTAPCLQGVSIEGQGYS